MATINAVFSIQIHTHYVAEQSHPDNDDYVFSYQVRIHNVGQVTAQLISRHWIITDANHHVEEVRGLGVVGNQPLLKSGQHFEYSSTCRLPTATGSMRGTYHFVTEEGEPLTVPIPEFALALPRTLH